MVGVVVVVVVVLMIDMFDVLQGKCEQRYKECEKISLKETYDQVEMRETSNIKTSLLFLHRKLRR